MLECVQYSGDTVHAGSLCCVMSKRVAESQLTKDDAPLEDNVEDPGTGREKASADVEGDLAA